MHKESVANIVVVTVVVCLVCSVIVSTAAVGLRPLYKANQERNLQLSVLEVAGVNTEDQEIENLFSDIDVRIMELESGKFVDMDPMQFDMRAMLKDDSKVHALSRREDIARISVRPKYVKVYLLRQEGALDKVILPIYGYGLWSILYGFICLEEDGSTVCGIKFYDHAETPGLGGEVDNSRWKALWKGKRLYNEQGQVKLAVIKGRAKPNSPQYPHQIDGLSGATITSYGVSQMLQFWAGKLGYQTFLKQMATGTYG